MTWSAGGDHVDGFRGLVLLVRLLSLFDSNDAIRVASLERRDWPRMAGLGYPALAWTNSCRSDTILGLVSRLIPSTR